MSRDSTDRKIELVHPAYLDTEMLVTFLATLDDGISFTSEVAEKVAKGRDREGEGSASIGIPSIASLLGLTLSGQGRYKRRTTNDESVENKLVREHTTASLFNRLRSQLVGSSSIKQLSATSIGNFADVQAQDMVEISGEVIGNPLRAMLDTLSAFGPYMGLNMDDEVESVPAKASGAGQKRKAQAVNPSSGDANYEDVLKMYRIMKRDIERATVVDLLLESSTGHGIALTASRTYLTREAEDMMLGGQFRVLGKVTRVLPESGSINFLRRTALGFLPAEITQGMVDVFSEALSGSQQGFRFTDVVLKGPAIQILPLAIFI